MHNQSTHHPQSMKEMWSEWPAMKPLVEKTQKMQKEQELNTTNTTGTGDELIKPVYADELYRAQSAYSSQSQAALDEADAKRMKLRTTADQLFEQHKWSAAAEAYRAAIAAGEAMDGGGAQGSGGGAQELDDFELMMRAGCSHTFTPNDSDCVIGERYLRRAVELMPTLPNTWSVLAMNINRQSNLTVAAVAEIKAAAAGSKTATSPKSDSGGGSKKVDRSAEVIDCIWKMLRCPPPENLEPAPKHNFVIDGLKQASSALAKQQAAATAASGSGGKSGGSAGSGGAGGGGADIELKALCAEAIAVYPIYKSAIESSITSSFLTDTLWVTGKEWLHSGWGPLKDFKKGAAIFKQIMDINPNDYWATLLYGGCKTWGGDAQAGEPFIRRAVAMDMTIPNGFAVLAQVRLWMDVLLLVCVASGRRSTFFLCVAHCGFCCFVCVVQNLGKQLKGAEAIAVVEDMIGREFKSVHNQKDPDGKKQILDALAVAEKVYGKNSVAMKVCCAAASEQIRIDSMRC